MYGLLSTISRGELLKRQIPVFLSALVLAELFYKFHSFVLECAAFLATWYLLDAVSTFLWPRRDQAGRSESG